MVKALVGGPEGDRISVHDDLVARLKQECAVTYAREADGAFFLHEAMGGWPLEKKPDIILYDTGFFYPKAVDKINAFEQSVGFVKVAQCPVIVFPEPGLEEVLRPHIAAAGFYQINQPYNVEEVVAEVQRRLISASERILPSASVAKEPSLHDANVCTGFRTEMYTSASFNKDT